MRMIGRITRRLGSVALCGLVLSGTVSAASKDDINDFLPIQKIFKEGAFEAARTQLQSFLKNYPDSRLRNEAQLLLGQSEMNLSRYPEAAVVFEQLANETTSGEPHEAAVYWMAETYFKSKEYSLAIRHYSELIEKYPTSKFLIFAKYSRAWALHETGYVQEAMEEFEALAQEFPTHSLAAECRFKMGQCLHELERLEEAAALLSRFIQEDSLSPKVPNAAYLLGDCYRRLGEYGPALESFKKSMESGGKDALGDYAMRGMGWCYFELGRFEQALESFSSPSQNALTGALKEEFIFGRARSLQKLGRLDEALAAYETLLKESQNSEIAGQAFIWKARALEEAGRFQEAMDIFEEAVRRFPAKGFQEDIEYDMAWVTLRMGRWEEAVRYFGAVAETSHNEVLKVSALCRIADIYLDRGDFSKALEFYDRVLKDHADSLYADYAQYQSGVTLSRMGSLEAAILSFKSLPVHYPKSRFQDEALYWQGALWVRMNKFQEAAAQFKKMLSQYPDSALKEKADFQLGHCYFNLGQVDKAVNLFRSILDKAKDPELVKLAKYQLGWSYFKLNRETEAIREFEAFLTQFPDSDMVADVHFGLGEYYFNKGQYAKSRDYFSVIQEKHAPHAMADDARHWKAMAFEREGDIWASVREIRSLAAEYPRSDYAAKDLLKTAQFFVTQGKADEAKADLMKVITDSELEPERTLAQKKLAELLKAEGHLREAVFYFSEALKKAQGEVACETLFELAQTYETQGDLEKAASYYLQTSQQYPKNMIYADRARLEAARLYESLQKNEDAIEIYQRIADSTSNQAEFAREKVKALKRR